jgi:hypothetical protein
MADKRYLIVECNPIHRNIPVDHLTEKGYNIDAYLPPGKTNTEERFRLFDQQDIDAFLQRAIEYGTLILDRETCAMGKTFPAVLQGLKDHNYQGHLIVTTTLTPSDCYEMYKDVDATFLRKVFTLREMEEVL